MEEGGRGGTREEGGVVGRRGDEGSDRLQRATHPGSSVRATRPTRPHAPPPSPCPPPHWFDEASLTLTTFGES